MYMVNSMAKRRISKASKRRLSFFGPFCLIAIISFLISLSINVYTIYKLNIEKKQLEDKLLSLQEESEELKTDIEKLNDEEYLANYAREQYLYSKDGEYIIHIEEDEKELSNDIDSKINQNYLAIAISLFVFLIIIIYIIKKGNKK